MSTLQRPRVPEGLRDLMKDLTREILKEKPTDIYNFSENYFQSRLPKKENYAVKDFEPNTNKYDFSYIQNPQRYQIPVALVYSIIPEGLTNLIKDLIKAILREQPENLCDFAVEYFRHLKTATKTAESKEISYTAYENYFINKERFLFTPYVKCTCGRTFGEGFGSSYQLDHLGAIQHIHQNDSAAHKIETITTGIEDTNNNNVINADGLETTTIYSEEYVNSIYIIQRYFRRYLKRKTSTANSSKDNLISSHELATQNMSEETAAIIIQRTIRKVFGGDVGGSRGSRKQSTVENEIIPVVPQLQLNHNENDNISEAASYTSASTAQLSASESGRDTSELSTAENILRKTIVEGEEIENDHENITDFGTQNEAISINDVTEVINNEGAKSGREFSNEAKNEEIKEFIGETAPLEENNTQPILDTKNAPLKTEQKADEFTVGKTKTYQNVEVEDQKTKNHQEDNENKSENLKNPKQSMEKPLTTSDKRNVEVNKESNEIEYEKEHANAVDDSTKNNSNEELTNKNLGQDNMNAGKLISNQLENTENKLYKHENSSLENVNGPTENEIIEEKEIDSLAKSNEDHNNKEVNSLEEETLDDETHTHILNKLNKDIIESCDEIQRKHFTDSTDNHLKSNENQNNAEMNDNAIEIKNDAIKNIDEINTEEQDNIKDNPVDKSNEKFENLNETEENIFLGDSENGADVKYKTKSENLTQDISDNNKVLTQSEPKEVNDENTTGLVEEKNKSADGSDGQHAKSFDHIKESQGNNVTENEKYEHIKKNVEPTETEIQDELKLLSKEEGELKSNQKQSQLDGSKSFDDTNEETTTENKNINESIATLKEKEELNSLNPNESVKNIAKESDKLENQKKNESIATLEEKEELNNLNPNKSVKNIAKESDKLENKKDEDVNTTVKSLENAVLESNNEIDDFQKQNELVKKEVEPIGDISKSIESATDGIKSLKASNIKEHKITEGIANEDVSKTLNKFENDFVKPENDSTPGTVDLQLERKEVNKSQDKIETQNENCAEIDTNNDVSDTKNEKDYMQNDITNSIIEIEKQIEQTEESKEDSNKIDNSDIEKESLAEQAKLINKSKEDTITADHFDIENIKIDIKNDDTNFNIKKDDNENSGITQTNEHDTTDNKSNIEKEEHDKSTNLSGEDVNKIDHSGIEKKSLVEQKDTNKTGHSDIENKEIDKKNDDTNSDMTKTMESNNTDSNSTENPKKEDKFTHESEEDANQIHKSKIENIKDNKFNVKNDSDSKNLNEIDTTDNTTLTESEETAQLMNLESKANTNEMLNEGKLQKEPENILKSDHLQTIQHRNKRESPNEEPTIEVELAKDVNTMIDTSEDTDNGILKKKEPKEQNNHTTNELQKNSTVTQLEKGDEEQKIKSLVNEKNEENIEKPNETKTDKKSESDLISEQNTNKNQTEALTHPSSSELLTKNPQETFKDGTKEIDDKNVNETEIIDEKSVTDQDENENTLNGTKAKEAKLKKPLEGLGEQESKQPKYEDIPTLMITTHNENEMKFDENEKSISNEINDELNLNSPDELLTENQLNSESLNKKSIIEQDKQLNQSTEKDSNEVKLTGHQKQHNDSKVEDVSKCEEIQQQEQLMNKESNIPLSETVVNELISGSGEKLDESIVGDSKKDIVPKLMNKESNIPLSKTVANDSNEEVILESGDKFGISSLGEPKEDIIPKSEHKKEDEKESKKESNEPIVNDSKKGILSNESVIQHPNDVLNLESEEAYKDTKPNIEELTKLKEDIVKSKVQDTENNELIGNDLNKDARPKSGELTRGDKLDHRDYNEATEVDGDPSNITRNSESDELKKHDNESNLKGEKHSQEDKSGIMDSANDITPVSDVERNSNSNDIQQDKLNTLRTNTSLIDPVEINSNDLDNESIAKDFKKDVYLRNKEDKLAEQDTTEIKNKSVESEITTNKTDEPARIKPDVHESLNQQGDTNKGTDGPQNESLLNTRDNQHVDQKQNIQDSQTATEMIENKDKDIESVTDVGTFRNQLKDNKTDIKSDQALEKKLQPNDSINNSVTDDKSMDKTEKQLNNENEINQINSNTDKASIEENVNIEKHDELKRLNERIPELNNEIVDKSNSTKDHVKATDEQETVDINNTENNPKEINDKLENNDEHNNEHRLLTERLDKLRFQDVVDDVLKNDQIQETDDNINVEHITLTERIEKLRFSDVVDNILNRDESEDNANSGEVDVVNSIENEINKESQISTKADNTNKIYDNEVTSNYHEDTVDTDDQYRNKRSLNNAGKSIDQEEMDKSNNGQELKQDAKSSDFEIKEQNVDHKMNQDITDKASENDIDNDNSNDQETTLHNIGNKSPETLIGNQNLDIGRNRNYNQGLIGSISGQRFAETHLKSFWKEHQMNNEMPLGQYDYRDNEINNQTQREHATVGKELADLEKVKEGKFNENKNVSTEIVNLNKVNNSNLTESMITRDDIIEPKYLENNLENIYDANTTIDDDHSLKNNERLPRYFHGLTPATDKENLLAKRKKYQDPTTFTIPFDKSNKKRNETTSKTDTANNSEEKKTKNIQKLNLTNCEDVEPPLLDSETPTKLFKDLNEFEYDDVNMDITYTIDEIIRLKAEHDSQQNSDDNDENLIELTEYTPIIFRFKSENDTCSNSDEIEISEFSITPESMLQTIIELSESETPRPDSKTMIPPQDLLQPNDEDYLNNLEKISDSTSWTTGSKDAEDNSFVSDEFLEDENYHEEKPITTTENNSESNGGIYEYSALENPVEGSEYENLINKAPTPPDYDPFYEDLKENAANKIQRAYRKYQRRTKEDQIPADNNEYSEEVIKANNSILMAVYTIQKAFRSYHLRKNQKNLLNREETIYKNVINEISAENNEYSDEVIKANASFLMAVCTIQRAFRNYQLQKNQLKQEKHDTMLNKYPKIAKLNSASDGSAIESKDKENLIENSKSSNVLVIGLNENLEQTNGKSNQNGINSRNKEMESFSSSSEDNDIVIEKFNQDSVKSEANNLAVIKPTNDKIENNTIKPYDDSTEIERHEVDHEEQEAETENVIPNETSNDRNQNAAIKYNKLIGQFISSERQYSDLVNQLDLPKQSLKGTTLITPDITDITKIITEFVNSQKEFNNSMIPNEKSDESESLIIENNENESHSKYNIADIETNESSDKNFEEDNDNSNLENPNSKTIAKNFALSHLAIKSDDFENAVNTNDDSNDDIEIVFEKIANDELNNETKSIFDGKEDLEIQTNDNKENSIENKDHMDDMKEQTSGIATNNLYSELSETPKEPADLTSTRNEKTFKYNNLIGQFINFERQYSDAVNQFDISNQLLSQTNMKAPDINEITKIITEFQDLQEELSNSINSYENSEEPSIKKSASLISAPYLDDNKNINEIETNENSNKNDQNSNEVSGSEISTTNLTANKIALKNEEFENLINTTENSNENIEKTIEKLNEDINIAENECEKEDDPNNNNLPIDNAKTSSTKFFKGNRDNLNEQNESEENTKEDVEKISEIKQISLPFNEMESTSTGPSKEMAASIIQTAFRTFLKKKAKELEILNKEIELEENSKENVENIAEIDQKSLAFNQKETTSVSPSEKNATSIIQIDEDKSNALETLSNRMELEENTKENFENLSEINQKSLTLNQKESKTTGREEELAASIIQRAFRSYLHDRKPLNNEMELEESSKGNVENITEKNQNGLTFKQKESTELSKELAASIIQKEFRSFLQRRDKSNELAILNNEKELEESSKENVENVTETNQNDLTFKQKDSTSAEPSKELAASIIQKEFRSYLQRRNKSNELEILNNEINLEENSKDNVENITEKNQNGLTFKQKESTEPSKELAASIIQKEFRSYLQRRDKSNELAILNDAIELEENTENITLEESSKDNVESITEKNQNDFTFKPKDSTLTEPSKELAASIIQKEFRSYLQRRDKSNELTILNKEIELDENFENITLEENSKDNVENITEKNQNNLTLKQKDSTLTEPSKELAASIIQKEFRSYLQRRDKSNELAILNKEIELDENFENITEMNTKILSLNQKESAPTGSSKELAASKIQKAFRSYLQKRDKSNELRGLKNDIELEENTKEDVENISEVNQISLPFKHLRDKSNELAILNNDIELEKNTKEDIENISEENNFQLNEKESTLTGPSKELAASIIQQAFRSYLERRNKSNELAALNSKIELKENTQENVEDNSKFAISNKETELKANTKDNVKNTTDIDQNGLTLTQNKSISTESLEKFNTEYPKENVENVHDTLTLNQNESPATKLSKDVAASIIQKSFRSYLQSKPNKLEIINNDIESEENTNELVILNNDTELEENSREIIESNQNELNSTELSKQLAASVIQKAFRSYLKTKNTSNDSKFLNDETIYYEPTAPPEEDLNSSSSTLESKNLNQASEEQAARIIQKALRKFLEHKSKFHQNVETNHSPTTKWFVGDEPIEANESLFRSPSEISFDETEAYVELNDNSRYLVDASSNLEKSDENNISRSPTAPVSNSSNSVDLNNDKQTNISEEIVSVVGTGIKAVQLVEKDLGNADVPKEDANVLKENADNTENEINDDSIVSIRHANLTSFQKEKADKYTNLIGQFINSERQYSDVVNKPHLSIKEFKFMTPDINEITKILAEFVDSQKELNDSMIPYEKLEEPCIKKIVSRSIIPTDFEEEPINETTITTDVSTSSDIDNDTEDSLSTKTVKLHDPDMAIEKMKQRRDSTTKISNLDKPKDYNFDEPLVGPIDNLDTDEEGIVVNKLQREDTRESSAQSDVDVVIGGDNEETLDFFDNIDFDTHFPAKGSLKRVHTIAGDADAKALLKNVTIDESIKYIEPPDYEVNSGSLCLDDDTSENIRRKMMAYSLSEADSDYFEKNLNNPGNSSMESKSQKYDDFNVSTALIDNGDTSTETESTIVSAVTKIQAGARGYLTRKRLGRTSITSDSKSMPNDENNKVSFGNAAISESLEYLVQEAAAKRIQKVYRKHYQQKLAAIKQQNDSISPDLTMSMESSLAQKRSIMLQRGDALRNDSTPDEGNSSSNGSDNGNKHRNESKAKIKISEEHTLSTSNDSKSSGEQQTKIKSNDESQTLTDAKTSAAIRAKKIEENKMRWLAMRQNSMPVQIDSEVLRVIPKHMRKKIKSAESEKKKGRRRVLKD